MLNCRTRIWVGGSASTHFVRTYAVRAYCSKVLHAVRTRVPASLRIFVASTMAAFAFAGCRRAAAIVVHDPAVTQRWALSPQLQTASTAHLHLAVARSHLGSTSIASPKHGHDVTSTSCSSRPLSRPMITSRPLSTVAVQKRPAGVGERMLRDTSIGQLDKLEIDEGIRIIRAACDRGDAAVADRTLRRLLDEWAASGSDKYIAQDLTLDVVNKVLDAWRILSSKSAYESSNNRASYDVTFAEKADALLIFVQSHFQLSHKHQLLLHTIPWLVSNRLFHFHG